MMLDASRHFHYIEVVVDEQLYFVSNADHAIVVVELRSTRNPRSVVFEELVGKDRAARLDVYLDAALVEILAELREVRLAAVRLLLDRRASRMYP